MDARDSKPWKMHKVVRGVQLVEVKSWRFFVDFIREEHANCPAFVYRGQADAKWKVESTLDRSERRWPAKRNFAGSIPRTFDRTPATREEHFNAFKEAVRGRRGPNPPPLRDDEWWALAQHYGLHTPMLDWTYSPFVAMFFAFEEEKVLNGEGGQFVQPSERAVYSLSSSYMNQIGDKASTGPALFSPRGEISNRLVNQGGLFLWMPEGKDLEGWVEEYFNDDERIKSQHLSSTVAMLQKIVIAATNDDRIECLKFLNKMNINRASLFPDLDGAAQYINALWELDFDTSLGFIPDEIDTGVEGGKTTG